MDFAFPISIVFSGLYLYRETRIGICIYSYNSALCARTATSDFLKVLPGIGITLIK